VESLLAEDKHFAAGLNIADGMLVHPAVHEALSSHFPQLTPGARFSGQHLSQQTDSQGPEAVAQVKVAQLN
jgi:hypothetical protein